MFYALAKTLAMKFINLAKTSSQEKTAAAAMAAAAAVASAACANVLHQPACGTVKSFSQIMHMMLGHFLPWHTAAKAAQKATN